MYLCDISLHQWQFIEEMICKLLSAVPATNYLFLCVPVLLLLSMFGRLGNNKCCKSENEMFSLLLGLPPLQALTQGEYLNDTFFSEVSDIESSSTEIDNTDRDCDY